MQQPTCVDVHVRTVADAHKVFAAIQRGVLHMVTRRLDADERTALRSGCIYAWEERNPSSELTGLGIERFTEGRRWSASRVRDDFLFYYEKLPEPLPGTNERQPPRDWDPLIKQTYSAWVETDRGPRKWHLNAYFTQGTIDKLGSVDDYSSVRAIVVPEGVFRSAKVGKSRHKTEDSNRTDPARAVTSNLRTFAPFPIPYPNGSPNMAPVLMHQPYNRSATVHQPSVYDDSPSPTSPDNLTSYFPNQGSYSRSPSMDYASLLNTMSSPTFPGPSRPYALAPISDENSYHNLRGHHSSGYGLGANFVKPEPITPSSSSIYDSATRHAYRSNSPNSNISPSYALQSAHNKDAELTLPPLRLHDQALGRDRLPQGIYSQLSVSADPSLSPLAVLRRPPHVRRPRDPLDESTLRLLLEKKPYP